LYFFSPIKSEIEKEKVQNANDESGSKNRTSVYKEREEEKKEPRGVEKD
jgi:hypothetical protein